MRYVPDLIPKDRKVLPDYFKGSPYDMKKNHNGNKVFGVVTCLVLSIIALTFIRHFLLFLTIESFALLQVPTIAIAIQRSLRFKLTPRVKIVGFVAFLLLSLPLYAHYHGVDLRKAEAERVAIEKRRLEERELQRKEDIRKADVQNRFLLLKGAIEKSNLALADSLISDVANKAALPSEKQELKQLHKQLVSARAKEYLENGKYIDALPLYTDMLSSDPGNLDLLYNRALCLSKTGKIAEAVADLKTGISNGDSRAEKLHDKINPLRRRVIGYTTLCCDGSTSSATGRGACSWHGGVCDWNHPVYEEYRKYE